MPATQSAKRIGFFVLTMINVSAVVSIRNVAIMAQYGTSIILYMALAALMFFIPVALVSAELSTTWPKLGGVYDWVDRAFGAPWGFVAGWLLWVQNVIWFPATLAFVATTFSYAWNPSLGQNSIYALIAILIGIWGTTLVNLFGIRASSWVSTGGLIIGTLAPILGIIVLAISSPSTNIQDVSVSSVPDITTHPSLRIQVSYLLAIILAISGMEMSAVHARDVKSPQRTYARAILASGIIVMTVYVGAALAVASLVPREILGLTEGVMQAFSRGLEITGHQAFIPFLAISITIGGLAMINTWTAGPVKTLLASADNGELPEYWQYLNRHGAPARLLLMQAVLASLAAMVFLLLPSVNASYWILSVITGMLYCLMYILMFVAAFRLRRKYEATQRPFRIAGGIVGMGVVCGVGTATCILVIMSGFIPPTSMSAAELIRYEMLLVTSLVILAGAPWVILKLRRKK